MHCNLRPPEPRQPFSALITAPCQVWSRQTYPLLYYNVSAADTLLCAVTLTFDHEHLQRIASDMMKLSTKFERNRAICGGVIAISAFDLMTLNIALHVALGSGINFTKFNLRQFILAWIIAFFDADTLCYAVTLSFDPLILKVRGTSSVTLSKSVRNLSEIEQSLAELLIIFANFCTHYVTLQP